jgi:hypothetical protein
VQIAAGKKDRPPAARAADAGLFAVVCRRACDTGQRAGAAETRRLLSALGGAVPRTVRAGEFHVVFPTILYQIGNLMKNSHSYRPDYSAVLGKLQEFRKVEKKDRNFHHSVLN